MPSRQSRTPRFTQPKPLVTAVALAMLSMSGFLHAQEAQQDMTTTLEAIQVSSDWLGTGLEQSVKTYAGARTVVKKEQIEESGASNIGDVMRRIPGVQSTDNSGTAGSAISLNIGVRGLTGRYSPRSTVLLDGIPMAVAPYGQPQLSFAPVSLNNIESIDVVRGGGAVRYGPQNVGGIINFKTRAIPNTPGVTGDATLRQNDFGEGGSNTQYSTFIGGQLDNGLGIALLYSGSSGQTWREHSDESVNDFALKFRYGLTPSSELYGKISYYDVKSRTPGGLSVAQYQENPFQNTRPTDYWNGDRKGIDVGYLNAISDTQEFEIRSYFNESFRQSVLINAAGTQLTHQPRNYRVFGIEPRYTQRLQFGDVTNDVTIGYRYISERGDDNSFSESVATGVYGPAKTFDNATDAHAVYIDDKIVIGAWRITPGVRFEDIKSVRDDNTSGPDFKVDNDEWLPSLNVAYLLSDKLTLFSNYGKSFGPVQNIQLNSQSANNPLQPEVAKTFEVGARWVGDRLKAELTAFAIRFDNQIQQVAGSNPAVFRNIGKTKHDGIETAIDYTFGKDSLLAGFNVYANYTYVKALLDSGEFAGNDIPFYSRNTDTIGLAYKTGAWRYDLSTTHQSKQYADNANTVVEDADGGNGEIPGFRVWNAQISWKMPNAKGLDVMAGINNLTDKRYYTRNVDGNAGRMVGAPRTIYIQGRYAF